MKKSTPPWPTTTQGRTGSPSVFETYSCNFCHHTRVRMTQVLWRSSWACSIGQGSVDSATLCSQFQKVFLPYFLSAAMLRNICQENQRYWGAGCAMVVRRCSSYVLRASGEVTKAPASQRRLAWACFYSTSVNSTHTHLPTKKQRITALWSPRYTGWLMELPDRDQGARTVT